MADLYVNFLPSEEAGNSDASEVLTTTGVKASTTAVSKSLSGAITLFSSVAHKVHIGAAPDADGATAFILFPGYPRCIEGVGAGVKISAKTI